MPDAAELDEDGARRLCLLQACEDGPPDEALWSPEDAAWASRLADDTAPPAATDAQWLAERARHAQQRLLPRRAALARVFNRGGWSARTVAWATLAGALLGAAADLIGPSRHVDLLAAPVWAVVAWNALVYLWIAASAWRGIGRAEASPGPLRRGVQRWLAGASSRQGVHAHAPEQRFAARWASVAAPLAAGRAATVLHLAAAALAVGLVAGLYARALVFDYRVGWQSTLLEPAQVHGLLAVLLAPASALTGIAVPDVDAVAALRMAAPGAAAAPSPQALSFGSAAPWLHLLAATLGCAVIVPRLVLALWAAAGARLRARRLAVIIDDAPSLKLLQARRRHAGAGRTGGVQVLPHGFTPAPAATLALRSLLAACFGETAVLHIAASTLYGDEDRAPPTPPPGTAWRIAWFDLAATPEPQAQGRFAAQIVAQAAGPLALLVDESGYRQRLGAASPRLAERRQAWQALADEAGVGLACVDLLAAADDAAALAAARAALEAALAVRTVAA
ncbi:MAG: DUF2868 domain-containing protein [Burkholderiales bacterium]|nr:DUF2868 domain-containing protein [Burkholderiales bacterium]